LGGEKGDGMPGLEQYNTEELQSELERREKEKKERSKPVPLSNPKWDKILESCEWYIDKCYLLGYEPKDGTYWIYSAAVTAIYGDEVWDWLTDKVR
jgi:hypothetical protein